MVTPFTTLYTQLHESPPGVALQAALRAVNDSAHTRQVHDCLSRQDQAGLTCDIAPPPPNTPLHIRRHTIMPALVGVPYGNSERRLASRRKLAKKEGHVLRHRPPRP